MADADQPLWTARDHENFVLDLEFKTEPNANSGVLVYCTHPERWLSHAIEIQVLDDSDPRKKYQPTWQCGAIFGRLPPAKNVVKKPGEWNHYTIACMGQQIDVVLNGEHIVSMDMGKWTSGETNPDGTKIYGFLGRQPLAERPTKGRIGLQGTTPRYREGLVS